LEKDWVDLRRNSLVVHNEMDEEVEVELLVVSDVRELCKIWMNEPQCLVVRRYGVTSLAS